MPAQPIRPGVRIGKYEVLAHIATGGMSKVYKARDVLLNRVVALKVLTRDLAERPNALERFRREARNAARLSHKNVVTLYEFGEEQGTHYLALEYVEGIDLYEYIERKGQLQPEEARRILLQAVKALDHAYHHGIVHRDIKPSNFLLAIEKDRLRVKLTDLGLARTAEDEEQFRVTRAGSTVGTIDYLSPEQARDSAAADIRSDIYSLGCTFYHMLAGKPPFAEGGLGERVYKHISADPPDVREANPEVSEAMWATLRRMLAKKPEERHQTPAELLADLKGLAGDTGPMQAITAASLQPRHLVPEVVEFGSAGGSSEERTPVPPTAPPPVERPASWDEPPATKPPSSSGTQTTLRDDPALLGLTPEQVEAAAAQFQRALQAYGGNNLEYAFDLLLTCCKLDPLTFAYRQKLREVGQALVRKKGKGGWLAGITLRSRFKSARRSGDVRKTLEHGEELLVRNPDDMRVHLDMAEVAEQHGLRRLAVWLLEQARARDADHVDTLKALARMHEKVRDVQAAIRIWEQVRRAAPDDAEAHHKVQDLSANYTINRNRSRI